MNKKFKNFIFVVSFIVVSIILFSIKERVVFEYYVWNLSSENYETREENSTKIITLGKDVIPLLLNKLNNKYIYETDYVVYCLEEITKQHGNYNTTDSAISYWKNWGKIHHYIK